MTEDQLNELSIFALRELARRTGVYAPTSKKKSELIKDIIDISEGRKAPYIAKTKQGRPPKDIGYSFADILISKPYSTMSQPSNIMTFNQNKKTFYYDDDLKTIFGFVELLTNGSALLWVRKQDDYIQYFIPESMIGEYNIKTGDKLLVEVSLAENQLIVKNIFNINDIPIMKYDKKRKDYYDIEHVEPQKPLEFEKDNFNSFKIKLGESVYLYGSDNKNNTKIIIDLLNSCKIDKKMYINISIAEKNKYLLNDLKNCEMFVTNITSETDKVKRLLNIASERAKHIMENGENVLIAIDDVLSLSGIDSIDLPITKNLLSLTKCGIDSGSISLFAVMPADKNVNAIEKLADKRIKIENDKLILM